MIESTVVSSQFEKIIRDDRESVALIIIYFMSGVFVCLCLICISIEEGCKNLRWHIGH